MKKPMLPHKEFEPYKVSRWVWQCEAFGLRWARRGLTANAAWRRVRWDAYWMQKTGQESRAQRRRTLWADAFGQTKGPWL